MAKYITNKQVNNSKANELNDFDGMGNAIWNFISLIYKAKWDSLYTDNKATTLRMKISSKFILRVAPGKNNTNKETSELVPISIKKALPPPMLPAKSKNEVNTISKYFQGNKTITNSMKLTVRNRPATELVTLKVHNIKLSFDIWLVLYMYFILYF